MKRANRLVRSGRGAPSTDLTAGLCPEGVKSPGDSAAKENQPHSDRKLGKDATLKATDPRGTSRSASSAVGNTKHSSQHGERWQPQRHRLPPTPWPGRYSHAPAGSLCGWASFPSHRQPHQPGVCPSAFLMRHSQPWGSSGTPGPPSSPPLPPEGPCQHALHSCHRLLHHWGPQAWAPSSTRMSPELKSPQQTGPGGAPRQSHGMGVVS